jgi:hypothetical protein
MSISADIERLLQQRSDHERQIAAIDSELERVRAALGGVRAKPVHRDLKREIRPNGSLVNLLYAELEKREPQTLAQLAVGVKRSKLTLYQALGPMVVAGHLFSKRLTAKGRPRIYARTAEGLSGHIEITEEPSSDDELGQGMSEPSDAASITSGTAGVQ